MQRILLFFFSLTGYTLHAQTLTQTIRGTVVDKLLQKPIMGATIRIDQGKLGDASDSLGLFSIPNVEVGSHQIVITAMGYKEVVMNNMVLNAGKEMVLTVAMEEKVWEGKEIKIKTSRRKNIPLNEMSVVSARSFTVEETQKYAAAVNDPARMASNYAGVNAADDGNNQIVIRGNSPSGLLWRMEGIDIPNPNHFSTAGSSGGGISILSTQLLSNSDFVTSAFSAEYGNALSGVFDLKLRKGNNQRREFSAQAGVLGLNIAAEGPFQKGYQGSYLFNYRYSTLSVLNALGLGLTPSVTNFQDLSYHIYLPTRKLGQFTLFSFGGLSNQYFNVKKDSSVWKTENDKYGDNFISNTGLWGATHQLSIGKKSLWKTALAYSLYQSAYKRNYTLSDYQPLNVFDHQFANNKLSLNSSLQYRVNAKTSVRGGFMANHLQFRYKESVRETLQSSLVQTVNENNATQTLQGYVQVQSKVHPQLTLQGGLHSLFLILNNKTSLEPRAALRYDPHPKHTLSLGYGLHSQIQGLGIYFTNIDGQLPNKNLGFSKAHHFVVSHQYSIQTNVRLKTELYYQHLYNIPVSISDSNTFSVINQQADFVRIAMNNKGKGKNYGLECSLEKYLSRNLYYMVSTSWYQSKYTAANGKQFNTRYNGNGIVNILGGKEFVSKNI